MLFRGFVVKVIYLLCFIVTFGFCAPRACTTAEAASIGCSGANYSCFIDAEEYQDNSSKNIPHCIRKFTRTWTIDTNSFSSGLAQDHYHIYARQSSPWGHEPLIGMWDDHSKGLRQRSINGNLNTRVNGDIATIGATIMIPQYTGYNFVPDPSNVTKTSSTADRIFLNTGSFASSNYTLCQKTYIYNPNKYPYCQNSSSSTFDFSEKNTFIQNNLEGKNVVYARLYWGGSLYQNWAIKNLGSNLYLSALNYIKGYSRIDFKAPGKSVITIDADPKDVFWFGSFSEYKPKSMTLESYNQNESNSYYVKAGINYQYVASADVTDIVRDSLGTSKSDRTFYAGNIRSTAIPFSDEFIDPNDGIYKVNNSTNRKLKKTYGTLLFSPVQGQNGYWIQSIAPQFAAWSLVIIYDFDDKTAAANNIEPKLVSIFDGLERLAADWMKSSDPFGTVKSSTVDVKFENIYTPKAGNIDASLTMFSFGGKPETKGEDIKIKNGGSYQSITSTNNARGDQFNSTMTKFGQLINPGKKFHSQADLDIFDISDKMSYAQKEADIKFTVTTIKSSGGANVVSADRINLALVGFSTRIYKPDVCYMEYIYAKKPSDSTFTKVQENTPTVVPANTILKTFVEVTNNTNEAAQDFALKATIDPSQIYNPNSTYIYADKASQGPSDLLTMSGQVHYNDNTGLQQLSGNDLTFYLGQGAAANKGGEMLIHQGNYAYAIYETTLKSKFEPNSYKATVANADINLQPYDTYIRRCSNQNYNITLGVSASPNNFVASNRQDDGSAAFKTKFKNRLLTKIVSTPFNVYITNYDTDGNKKVPDAPVDVKVELVESCNAPTNLYEQDITFNGVTDILLSGISIDRAYKSVKFRISHLDPVTNTTKVECEKLDDFAIRPSHFRLWDTDKNTINNNNVLIGGKVYNNIALAAMKPLDSGLANGYINNISGSNGEIKLVPAYSATCDPSIIESENKLSVDFNDPNKALGKIFRHTSSGPVGFSYSDIGDTYFYVLDKDYTITDQHTPSRADDCVKNSISNDPSQDTAQEGRIGCNIKLEGNRDYLFRPKDIQISKLKITKDSDITYLDNEGIQKAKLDFEVTARLFNDDPAKLYNEDCYAKNMNFDIKLDRVPLNFTDNDGNAGTLAKANEEILFFEIPGSNTRKAIDPSATKSTFYVEKNTFVNGVGKGEVYFNFERKVNHAKNPFTISSNDFSFSGMSDSTDTVKKYEKPATETTAKFYFGRVYAPFYEGLYSGFYAKIYYGAYCDGCNKNIYMKDNGKLWQDFPAAPFWATNPKHSAGVLNYHDFSFTNTYSGTVLRNDVSSISNGEQIIFIRNPSAVTDVAKMRAPSWLLYSEFDEKPETNNFNLNFLVPNGEWAGKVLKSNNIEDKTSSAVGGFIGVKSNSDSNLDISDKTNRRIEW